MYVHILVGCAAKKMRSFMRIEIHDVGGLPILLYIFWVLRGFKAPAAFV